MNKILNIDPIYIIVTSVLLVTYYIIVIRYDLKSRKNKKNNIINNIDNKSCDVKNIHIFDENFKDAPTYNKKIIIPVSTPKNSYDWRKTLDDINAQSAELHTNNEIDQILFDNDIDLED